jgi:hypothetical protein
LSVCFSWASPSKSFTFICLTPAQQNPQDPPSLCSLSMISNLLITINYFSTQNWCSYMRRLKYSARTILLAIGESLLWHAVFIPDCLQESHTNLIYPLNQGIPVRGQSVYNSWILFRSSVCGQSKS